MKKLLLFLIILITSTLTTHAQKELWGMTSEGGEYSAGTIFKTDQNGDNQQIVHDLFQYTGKNPRFTKMCEAGNGKLYGMTYNAGAYGFGVLFEFDPATDNYIIKLNFDGANKGMDPNGSLMQADNGKLYGMTAGGGSNYDGVLFEFDPATGTYIKKLDFDGENKGRNPYGSLMQADNGKLYGMTRYGGSNNYGVLFEFDPATGTYTKKLDFDGANKGSKPQGSLMQANNGKLYGMTYQGGANNYGVLFEFDPATGIYTKKIDFERASKGGNPTGSLMQADIGKIYGMTRLGGSNGYGVLFEYDLATDNYSKKLDFDGANKGTNPLGSLMQADNGKLYGMTNGGGSNNYGVLFEFDPATDTYTKKLDFDGANKGRSPFGSLMQADNGKLYGMTLSGGSNNNGVLFEFAPATGIYSKKLDFDEANKGRSPFGSLMQADNGKLYGMTNRGGSNNYGVLFEHDPATGSYTKKLDFDGANIGRNPYSSLMQADNGKLYGMTLSGGSSNDGVLFEFDPATGSYTKKLDFDGANKGESPYSSLMQADNGKLYGITSYGGSSNDGVLFEFDPATGSYTKKLDFDGANKGKYPRSSLMQADNGKLYGMTNYGGSSNNGVLFEFDPATDTYTKKLDFGGANKGSNPLGSLMQANNGKLYGMTNIGGSNNYGVLFEFDPATDTYTKKLDFDGANKGRNPRGSLMQADNGKLYGMTSNGGSNSYGVLFEFNPATDTYTKKLDFTGENGKYPYYTHLIQICPPKLTSIQESICDGDSIFLEDAWQTEAGIYYDTLSTVCGSDSIIETQLSVNETFLFTQEEEICNGDTLTWRGSEYDSAGTYYDSLLTINGCDSLYQLNLTVHPTYVFQDTTEICEGQTYTWRGEDYTTTGTYYDSLTTVNGCDSVYIIELTVNPTYLYTDSTEICEGTMYAWRQNDYSEAGIFYDSLITINGCDSVYKLVLTVHPVYEFIDSVEICENETYTWRGDDYIESGTYFDSLLTVNGCDSVYVLELTANSTYLFTENAEICQGETYTWRGKNYNAKTQSLFFRTCNNILLRVSFRCAS